MRVKTQAHNDQMIFDRAKNKRKEMLTTVLATQSGNKLAHTHHI